MKTTLPSITQLNAKCAVLKKHGIYAASTCEGNSGYGFLAPFSLPRRSGVNAALLQWLIRSSIGTACAILLVTMVGFRSSGADANAKIKVLLITGGHAFEQEPFFTVFRDNPEITLTTAAHGDKDADAYDRDDLTSFDVVVLYDMRKTITEGQRARFMSLFEKGVGLVVLHHAIVSYQHWPEYEKVIGGKYPEEDGKSGVVTDQAGYKHDEEVPVVIVAKDHPVTAGLKDFTIHDEIYWGFHTTDDVTPLITTTHPKSGKPLAWCRTQGKSRVVYLQLGHDHQAYENPNYQKLVANSIRWTAKRDGG